MNALKTMVFGLAALGAVSLGGPAAAATTVLTYVGSEFEYRFGPEPIGPRITATMELASPLAANFAGSVAWSSFTISDGVHTLSGPFTFTITRFATDADGKIINWQVQAGVFANGVLITLNTINYLAGQFGATSRDSAFDIAEYQTRTGGSNGIVPDSPGVWTVTTRADPGVVPEPGTWALMIVGFGLAGAGLRRVRAAAAA